MRTFLSILSFFILSVPLTSARSFNVSGHVSANGRPVAGVQVSDGRQIVLTDTHGSYRMQSDKADSMVFITVPSGYQACRKNSVTPAFFALLTKPANRPEVHDFQLELQDQSDYSVIFMTDVHFSKVKNGGDRDGVKNALAPLLHRLAGQRRNSGKAVYAVSLGDFAHDQNWYEVGFDEMDAHRYFSSLNFEFPVFGVSGNHDNDGAVVGENVDFRSAWQVRRCWGPDRYSINIGKDHWIFIDNIKYLNEPGKGNLGVGIKGKRNYVGEISQSQMEWLRKDLSYVPDGTAIYLCTHCPLFNTHREDERMDSAFIPVIDKLFARFPSVTVYSGHAHMMHIPECDANGHFRQFVLPATSGNMWINYSEGRRCINSEGTPGGVFVGDSYCGGKPEYDYVTLFDGPQCMTVYDMNEVGRLYAGDENVRWQMELYSGYLHDYSQPEFENMVFVNYWMFSPGESVYVIENGVELNVNQAMMEDPVYNLTRIVNDAVQAGKFKKKLSTYRYPHMFVAKAATADAPLLVQVRDASGKVIREQEVVRPLKPVLELFR